jgi:hypothetical protein
MSASRRIKVIAGIAVTLGWMTFNPRLVSAQTSGIGSDLITRVLWRGTDGSASIWRLNQNLEGVGARVIEPQIGWTPIALTVAPNNNTYLLWRHSDGRMSIWQFDADLNGVGSRIEGPFAGWTAQSISSGANSQLRLIWRYTTGQLGVWALNANLSSLTSQAFGPYFGWDPGAP